MKSLYQIEKLANRAALLKSLTIYVMFLIISTGCSKDKDPVVSSNGNILGTVKDTNENPYPNTNVSLNDGSATTTNAQGSFTFTNKNTGNYSLRISPPLSTSVNTQNPINVSVQGNQTTKQNFTIKTNPLNALVNIGNIDVFGEIKNVNNQIPNNSTEPLYSKNIFDAPIGQLTAIENPNDDPVTLAQWMMANGTVLVNCNGNTANIIISLKGLIPNGTYSFWLNFLNSPKQSSQSISLATDIASIQPLGSGSLNVAIADTNGNINATIAHTSCILTSNPGLVMAILYHINGNTYGSAHIPDSENATHMLVYFQ